jgi:hypothetical protein
MDNPASPQLHSYACWLLNRELKKVRTVTFEAYTDDEAVAAGAEMLHESPTRLALAGFEIRKDINRLLVRLENSDAPPDIADIELTLLHSATR